MNGECMSKVIIIAISILVAGVLGSVYMILCKETAAEFIKMACTKKDCDSREGLSCS
jgi:hypothetical protein